MSLFWWGGLWVAKFFAAFHSGAILLPMTRLEKICQILGPRQSRCDGSLCAGFNAVNDGHLSPGAPTCESGSLNPGFTGAQIVKRWAQGKAVT